MAARGARAAGRADAAHRRAHDTLAADDPEVTGAASRRSCRGCSNWAGPIGRNVRIDYSLGRRRCRPHSQIRGGIGRARAGRHPGHRAPHVGPLLQATRTVPIVFVLVADPVGAGFVESLARPGGNATGFTQFEYSMSGKWLELLKEIAPGVTRAAVLRDPAATIRDRPVRRNPGRGAVVRGGGEPDRRARRRRDRARRHGVRARARMAA